MLSIRLQVDASRRYMPIFSSKLDRTSRTITAVDTVKVSLGLLIAKRLHTGFVLVP
jgi:hypothetical protein